MFLSVINFLGLIVPHVEDIAKVLLGDLWHIKEVQLIAIMFLECKIKQTWWELWIFHITSCHLFYF